LNTVCGFLIPQSIPQLALNWPSLSGGVAVANLIVAIIAMYLGWLALKIARRTMQDAEEDWKHRKWYDLYFKAAEAYDLLDRYRTLYSVGQGRVAPTQAMEDSWNDLMMHVRVCHTMSTVFPKNRDIDDLHEATKFSKDEYVYDNERFKKFGDAVEGLRQKALLKPSVLE